MSTLVQEDDDARHFHLTGEQDVLTGLGHRSVRGTDDQDRAVHLGRTGDHVLDVVGVTGAVDVGIVPFLGLVLDVGNRDRDAALPLFRRVVDRVEAAEGSVALERQRLGDRRRQASSCHGRRGRSCPRSNAASSAQISALPIAGKSPVRMLVAPG